MKIFLLLLCAAACAMAQDRDPNYTIRFEPTAVLQANIEVPFTIHVTDDRRKPVGQAKVTLQIETAQHKDVKVYRASATDAGIYIAKPVFPSAGLWSVYVEVRRNGEMSARTIEFNVPESVSP